MVIAFVKNAILNAGFVMPALVLAKGCMMALFANLAKVVESLVHMPTKILNQIMSQMILIT
jgi:hypothetical protein